jgi:hypothetical protein
MGAPSPYAVAAFSALGGFVLSQVAIAGKSIIYALVQRYAVLDEVRQLDDELKRLEHIYARHIQIGAKKGVERGGALPLPNVIYTSHFKDAAIAFTRAQRSSIQMIYAHVDAINDASKKFTDLADSLHEKYRREGKLREIDGDEYGLSAADIFRQVRVTRWHINHHRTNPWLPDLDPGTKFHAEYQQFVEKTNATVENIKASADGVARERFDKIYDPDALTAYFGDSWKK